VSIDPAVRDLVVLLRHLLATVAPSVSVLAHGQEMGEVVR
jgi:hypothetical protein